jgi:hypothetical protein
MVSENRVKFNWLVSMVKVNFNRVAYEKVLKVWGKYNSITRGEILDDGDWTVLKQLLGGVLEMTNGEATAYVSALEEAYRAGKKLEEIHDYDWEIIIKEKHKKDNVFSFRKD